MPIDHARLAAIAARQFGAFTLHDALACGYSPATISRRTQRGEWRRLHPGVYVHAAVAGSTHQRYMAATLATPNAVISGRAAGHLHGLEGCRAVPPEITVRPSGNARIAGVRVRRRCLVERTRVENIPVTSVPQTLADLCATRPFVELQPIFDDAFLANRVRRSALEIARARAQAVRPPGGSLFLDLVHERLSDVGTYDSVLEVDAARLLRRLPGKPRIEHQVAFDWWKGGTGRFDSLIVPWRILVEADGRRWHQRVAAFEEDRYRDMVAAAHGYLVVRVTAAQIRNRRRETIELLTAAGGLRATA